MTNTFFGITLIAGLSLLSFVLVSCYCHFRKYDDGYTGFVNFDKGKFFIYFMFSITLVAGSLYFLLGGY